MAQPNITVIEFQKRASHAEFLRWSKSLEDTQREFEELPEGDPKRVYLKKFESECKIMTEHYREENRRQEATITALRDINEG